MDDIRIEKIGKTFSKIYNSDSRKINTYNNLKQNFKLCVMSPPYLNSFDYTDVYRPELFLGGFVKTMDELRRLRLKTMRSHVQVKWEKPVDNDFGDIYKDCLGNIKSRSYKLWNKNLPEMIQAYFEDLKLVFRNLRQKADPQASLWVVVSTSAYAGVEIPVDLILAKIGSKSQWFLREIQVMRYLRRVPVQQWDELSEREAPYLRESIIIFDANRQ